MRCTASVRTRYGASDQHHYGVDHLNAVTVQLYLRWFAGTLAQPAEAAHACSVADTGAEDGTLTGTGPGDRSRNYAIHCALPNESCSFDAQCCWGVCGATIAGQCDQPVSAA